MHLDLQFPPAWVLNQAPGNQFVAVLPAASSQSNALPRAIVTFGPIEMRPDEPKAWQEGFAASDTPRGARVRLGRTIDHETVTGWPLRLLEVELSRIDSGEVIEVRLCAFFTFFEHMAAVMVRSSDKDSLEAVGPEAMTILGTGRPNWSGATQTVAGLWDLPSRVITEGPRVTPNIETLGAELAELDLRLAATPDVDNLIRRGRVLLQLKRPADAATALQAALALDEKRDDAHYFLGVAHGDLDRHGQAIESWESSAALAPRPDTFYNIGQARFFLKQYDQALAAFEKVRGLEPNDFLTGRKVVQCLYALGRYDEGQAARVKLRAAWEKSRDPRARFVTEYVFDQFDADGFSVHAIEILKPSKPSIFTLLVFQAIAIHGHHDHPLPASVHIETSDEAQAAGTPFVIGLRVGDRFQVIGAAAALPAYPDTKQEISRVLRDALAAAAH